MPYDAKTLSHMATDGYFGNVGRKDIEAVMAPFAQNAVMEIIGKDVLFNGKRAIRAHFEDFLEAYKDIAVEIFDCTVDVEAQRMCTRFQIALTPASGEVHTMRNLNHFQVSPDGEITYVRIFMSDTPRDGFAQGNSAR